MKCKIETLLNIGKLDIEVQDSKNAFASAGQTVYMLTNSTKHETM